MTHPGDGLPAAMRWRPTDDPHRRAEYQTLITSPLPPGFVIASLLPDTPPCMPISKPPMAMEGATLEAALTWALDARWAACPRHTDTSREAAQTVLSTLTHTPRRWFSPAGAVAWPSLRLYLQESIAAAIAADLWARFGGLQIRWGHKHAGFHEALPSDSDPIFFLWLHTECELWERRLSLLQGAAQTIHTHSTSELIKRLKLKPCRFCKEDGSLHEDGLRRYTTMVVKSRAIDLARKTGRQVRGELDLSRLKAPPPPWEG